MKAEEPARAAPTGAPRPLLKSIQMDSKWRPNSAAGVPVATTAFITRAPSQWVLRPCSWATSVTPRTCSSDQQLPPPKFEVCSTDTSLETGECRVGGRSAAATCAGVKMPRSPCSGRSRARLMTAGPAGFEGERVRGGIEDDLVAGVAMNREGDHIAHRP